MKKKRSEIVRIIINRIKQSWDTKRYGYEDFHSFSVVGGRIRELADVMMCKTRDSAKTKETFLLFNFFLLDSPFCYHMTHRREN